MNRAALQGRRLLLTGASRGIGRAVAERLLEGGARLALLVRDPAGLPAPLQQECLVQQADLSALRTAEQAQAWVQWAVDTLGGLDGLVNCAGIVHYEHLLDTSLDALRDQWQVNFLAPFALCQAAARALIAAGQGGDLIQVSSTLAQRPAPATGAYSTTKAALNALTRACALEFGPHGIRANAVAPGVIDTEMVRAPRPSAEAGAAPLTWEEQRAGLAGLHPLGRLGTAAEVAQAVGYLLSSPFVNGSVLTVDGGLGLG